MRSEIIAIDGRFLFRQKKGIGQYTLSLLTQLSEFRPDYKIIIFHDQKNIKKEIISIINDKIELYYLSNLFYPLWEFLLFPIYAFKKKSTIIHFVGNTGFSLIPKMLGIKIYQTIHDAYFMNPENKFPQHSNFKQMLGSIYRRYTVPKLAKNADKIFTVSEFAKSELIKFFQIDKEKLFVTYNTLDKQYFNYMKKIDLSIKEKIILIVSGDHPQKNLSNTLKFLKKNNRDLFKDWKLIICGKVNDKIKSIVNFDNIFFYEHIDQEKLIMLYKKSKILIFPSLFESFGLPLIESLSMGLTLISSNKGATREVAGKNALYYNPMNGDELNNQIKIATKITNNELEKELQERINFLQKYNNSVVGKIIEETY